MTPRCDNEYLPCIERRRSQMNCLISSDVDYHIGPASVGAEHFDQGSLPSPGAPRITRMLARDRKLADPPFGNR